MGNKTSKSSKLHRPPPEQLSDFSHVVISYVTSEYNQEAAFKIRGAYKSLELATIAAHEFHLLEPLIASHVYPFNQSITMDRSLYMPKSPKLSKTYISKHKLYVPKQLQEMDSVLTKIAGHIPDELKKQVGRYMGAKRDYLTKDPTSANGQICFKAHYQSLIALPGRRCRKISVQNMYTSQSDAKYYADRQSASQTGLIGFGVVGRWILWPRRNYYMHNESKLNNLVKRYKVEKHEGTAHT